MKNYKELIEELRKDNGYGYIANNYHKFSKEELATIIKEILMVVYRNVNYDHIPYKKFQDNVADNIEEVVRDLEVWEEEILEVLETNKIKPITLKIALQTGLIKLTDLEKKCLNAIRSQGSFYEESMDYNKETGEYEFSKGQFFGWELDEEEVKGCRGAIASLVKKGVLTTDEDNGMTAYYINYELEFKKDYIWEIDFGDEEE